MELLELVQAVLARDAVTARQWVLDAARLGFDWSTVRRPVGFRGDQLPVAAALVELFAARAGVRAPEWTHHIGPASHPVWLVTDRLPRFAREVERESPEPLRRRGVFAPDGFLTHV
jgi:hypothetical protein